MADSRIYKDWLAKAHIDLDSARILYAHGGDYATVAFHCQQAIEKGLKGFILKASKQLKDCAYVNQFYIESRYPADVPEALTKQDAEQCLSIAERVLALCEQEDVR